LELAWKPDMDRCMDRILAWFEQQVLDRPPVRFYKHNEQYEAGQALLGSRWRTLEGRWFDVEYQIDAFERVAATTTFQAETFPVFWPSLGPNVYSAFYAGRLDFTEVTSWYQPVLGDPGDLSLLQHNPFESVYFKKLEALTRRALEGCRGRYLVGYTDLHASLDCVAAWRGPTNLCLDMIATPEKLPPVLDRSVWDFQAIFHHFDATLKANRQPSVT